MSKLLSELTTKEEFQKASQPIFEFLKKYGTPHSTVVITQHDAEFMSGEMSVSYVKTLPIYKFTVCISKDGCITDSYAMSIEGHNLSELRAKADSIILTLATEHDLSGILDSVMLVEKDGEFYARVERTVFVSVIKDRVFYEEK